MIAAKYASGQTIRQLADAYRFSYTGMHSLLERNGVVFRSVGMARGSRKKRTNAHA
jgi:hypothetical protein